MKFSEFINLKALKWFLLYLILIVSVILTLKQVFNQQSIMQNSGKSISEDACQIRMYVSNYKMQEVFDLYYKFVHDYSNNDLNRDRLYLNRCEYKRWDEDYNLKGIVSREISSKEFRRIVNEVFQHIREIENRNCTLWSKFLMIFQCSTLPPKAPDHVIDKVDFSGLICD